MPEANLSINIHRQAARLAYYAQFHAAQALIFERTGKISKTHKGVGSQFHTFAQSELAIEYRCTGMAWGFCVMC